jgi:hypothetical protein
MYYGHVVHNVSAVTAYGEWQFVHEDTILGPLVNIHG